MSGRGGCKVDALIREYDLDSGSAEFDDVDEYLLALWQGEGSREAMGYRPLASWFNRRLLKRTYEEHGRLAVGKRLETEFELLAGEDGVDRRELLDDLAQDGIDGEQLAADMVSWSTLRRHLTACLDGEKAVGPAETDWERESVAIATDQLVEKVETALSAYETKGTVAGASDADVSVQVQLSCPSCPTRRSLAEARRLGYVCRDHLGES